MSVQNNPAIIIGNGTSRLWFALEAINHRGMTTFGCNALYRQYQPDYLVAIDEPIIEEINAAINRGVKVANYEFIVPPMIEQFEPAECNRDQPRSNAGMNAMLEAIKRGHKTLYCLGFDFLLGSDAQSVSNVYDGTPCYEVETRAQPYDTPGRCRFLTYIAKMNPTVAFWFVYPEKMLTRPDSVRAIEANNVYGMTYTRFLRELGYNT